MPCLDGLRGLAAVMVVLGHAPEFGLDSIVQGGSSHYGVLIFFALSGFLMGTLYLQRPFGRATVQDYVASRVARIVPIFYLVVVLSFLVYHLVDLHFAYNVTFIQLLRLLTFNGSTSVFWSIGPEFQFYFLFIPLWFLYRTALGPISLVLSLLAISVFCLATISHWPGVIVFSKFHIFACGLLVAILRFRILPHPPQTMTLAANLVGFILLALIMTSDRSSELLGHTHFDRAIDPAFTSFYGSIERTLVAEVIVFCFSYSSRIGTLVLANPVSALLGRCSFSIYLFHVAIYDVATRTGLMKDLNPTFGTIVVLGLVIGLAALSYQFVESPSRQYVKNRLTYRPISVRPIVAEQPA